jgi:hypothetical protein
MAAQGKMMSDLSLSSPAQAGLSGENICVISSCRRLLGFCAFVGMVDSGLRIFRKKVHAEARRRGDVETWSEKNVNRQVAKVHVASGDATEDASPVEHCAPLARSNFLGVLAPWRFISAPPRLRVPTLGETRHEIAGSVFPDSRARFARRRNSIPR